MVERLTDDEIWNLKRGGHDYRKVYAAYQAAIEHNGQPTVILAKTIKGWTLGSALRGPQRHAPDEEADAATTSRTSATGCGSRSPTSSSRRPLPAAVLPPRRRGSDEIRYLHERRRALGGYLPERRARAKALTLPGDATPTR